jgi:hypothetical protein
MKQHRTLLGEDLWELAKSVDAPLKKVVPLTTLPSEELTRGSFRIEFADGSTRKGRRLGSETDAEKVELLSKLLDHRFFPHVLARHRTALMIEWIDGRPLFADRLNSDLWMQCGEILGAMHALRVPQELSARYGCGAAGWRERIQGNIEALARQEALSDREAQTALRIAEKQAPDDAATGLIHGDFCVENFIETESAQIAIVDNETLSVDVCAYDLARTWSRSPMDQQQAQAFYEGYHRYRTSTDFHENHLYWAIAVLTEAAVFRLRAATVGIDELLERLKIILEWGELHGFSAS